MPRPTGTESSGIPAGRACPFSPIGGDADDPGAADRTAGSVTVRDAVRKEPQEPAGSDCRGSRIDDDRRADQPDTPLLVAEAGAVRTLTLHRPRAFNAFDSTLKPALLQALVEAAADTTCGRW